MSAGQRLTAAREYLAYAQGQRISHLPHPVLQRLAAELRRQLGQVLDVVAEIEASPDDGQLAQIRGLLAAFDWERDDRQYALEQIEMIVGGEDR